MRNKAVIFFVIFSLFVFPFFSGCDNGTTSVDPINPPYENIPNLDNFDAVFAGEDHTNRENFGVYLNLMKYYYSLGVRDFAFEDGYGSALLIQYYIDTGNEECLQIMLRNYKGSPAYTQERYNFYKELYKWNSTLTQKIKVHGFDIEHNYASSGIAAAYNSVLNKYPRIEGIPYITTPGSIQDFINDFKNNKGRYSTLSTEDLRLYERIVLNIEQGINWYAARDEVYRENCIIGNFRQIRNDTGGRKLFATMGAAHASLIGNTGAYNDSPPIGFTMASVLKNEIRIASIVLLQQVNTNRWQYIIPINESLKTTPFNSTYAGNWPWSDGKW
jgi:hypothetical protein